LKKQKDAIPFNVPVDPVALNIPHYPSIIKNPMDFSTIERKLNSSNPVKPDPNPSNPRYYNVEEFIADVRLVFSNTLTFNGPDHAVTAMGKRVEEVFDKQIKNLPLAEVVCSFLFRGRDSMSIPSFRSNRNRSLSRRFCHLHPHRLPLLQHQREHRPADRLLPFQSLDDLKRSRLAVPREKSIHLRPRTCHTLMLPGKTARERKSKMMEQRTN
jgi:hypothetical protein